jgi:hypothetical protein
MARTYHERHAAPPGLDPEALPLPLLGRLLPAGFPSPADDYLEGEIDLNRLLIERPAACYLMRVSGPSMSGAGIMDGDLVVVDRSVEAEARPRGGGGDPRRDDHQAPAHAEGRPCGAEAEHPGYPRS